MLYSFHGVMSMSVERCYLFEVSVSVLTYLVRLSPEKCRNSVSLCMPFQVSVETFLDALFSQQFWISFFSVASLYIFIRSWHSRCKSSFSRSIILYKSGGGFLSMYIVFGGGHFLMYVLFSKLCKQKIVVFSQVYVVIYRFISNHVS